MVKPFTVAALAKHLGGDIQGNPAQIITGIAPLQKAVSGDISFLDNPKYRVLLPQTKASAVILTHEMATKCPATAIIVPNPYLAYAKVAGLFEHKVDRKPGIHPTVIIGEDCEIDETATIGPYVVLGNRVKIGAHTLIEQGSSLADDVTLGSNCHFYPRVTVYHGCQIGHSTIIHSGAVIGSDGFGFAFHEGRFHKIPQIGTVEIGDDVEIGANTCIDRGALVPTVIGNGVKLDNQIQIGHNVEIGDHSVIAAGAAIGGSTQIGRYCRIGGLSGFVGHISLVDNVTIVGMSSVANSITESGVYASGIPAMPFSTWRRNATRLNRLDELNKRIAKLERLQGLKEEKEDA